MLPGAVSTLCQVTAFMFLDFSNKWTQGWHWRWCGDGKRQESQAGQLHRVDSGGFACLYWSILILGIQVGKSVAMAVQDRFWEKFSSSYIIFLSTDGASTCWSLEATMPWSWTMTLMSRWWEWSIILSKYLAQYDLVIKENITKVYYSVIRENFTKVVTSAVFACVGTAGQRCTTLRRLIVHEDLYDEVNS